jgi:hypothetical protein
MAGADVSDMKISCVTVNGFMVDTKDFSADNVIGTIAGGKYPQGINNGDTHPGIQFLKWVDSTITIYELHEDGNKFKQVHSHTRANAEGSNLDYDTPKLTHVHSFNDGIFLFGTTNGTFRYVQIYDNMVFESVITSTKESPPFESTIKGFYAFNSMDDEPVEFKGLRSETTLYALSCDSKTDICSYVQFFMPRPSLVFDFTHTEGEN